jgi:hypothetical protein
MNPSRTCRELGHVTDQVRGAMPAVFDAAAAPRRLLLARNNCFALGLSIVAICIGQAAVWTWPSLFDL